MHVTILRKFSLSLLFFPSFCFLVTLLIAVLPPLFSGQHGFVREMKFDECLRASNEPKSITVWHAIPMYVRFLARNNRMIFATHYFSTNIRRNNPTLMTVDLAQFFSLPLSIRRSFFALFLYTTRYESRKLAGLQMENVTQSIDVTSNTRTILPVYYVAHVRIESVGVTQR